MLIPSILAAEMDFFPANSFTSKVLRLPGYLSSLLFLLFLECPIRLLNSQNDSSFWDGVIAG